MKRKKSLERVKAYFSDDTTLSNFRKQICTAKEGKEWDVIEETLRVLRIPQEDRDEAIDLIILDYCPDYMRKYY